LMFWDFSLSSDFKYVIKTENECQGNIEGYR